MSNSNNVQTNVTVTAQAKGFQQAQTAAAKLTQTMHQGLSKISAKQFKKEMHDMEHALQHVAQSQLKLNDAMKGMSKGSAELKKAKDEMKHLEHQAHATERRISMLTKAFGTEKAGHLKKSHGGFTQGFLHGAIESMHTLERGPGVWAEAGGHVAGHAARHFAGAAATLPMHGMQAIGHMLSALPGGAALAAPLEEASGLAGGSIENIKKRQALLPFLSGINRFQLKTMVGASEDEVFKAGASARAAARAGGPERRYGASAGGGILGAMDMAHPVANSAEAQYTETGEDMADRLAKVRDSAEEQAKREKHESMTSFLGSQGMRFGMNKMEAEEFAAQITQQGGGTGRELATQGMFGAGAGAMRAYGIGGGTAGSFLGAGRKGGLTGVEGSSGDAMAQTIASALSAGLSGSEIKEYTEDMAASLESFKSTGIALNPTSIAKMGLEVGKMGVGVARGMAMTKGFGEAGMRLAQTGPTSGLDFMAAKHLYGYTGGGGSSNAWDFMKRASLGAGGIKQGGIEGLFGELSGRGDRSTAMMSAYSGLQRFGVKVGPQEIEEIFNLLDAKKSGNFSEQQSNRLAQINEQAAAGSIEANGVSTAAGLATRGSRMTNGQMKGFADLDNQKDIIGAKMIPAVHAFEKSALNIAQAVATGLTPSIGKIAHLTESFSDGVKGFIEHLEKMGIFGKTGHGGDGAETGHHE